MKLRPVYGFFAVLLIAGIWLLPSALTSLNPNSNPVGATNASVAVATAAPIVPPTQPSATNVSVATAAAEPSFTAITEQTSNGIWISAKNFRFDAQRQIVFAEVCFQLPTPNEDWLIDDAHIRIGDEKTTFPAIAGSLLRSVETQPDGTRQLITYDPTTGNPLMEAAGAEIKFDLRCDEIEFVVTGTVPEKAVITLEVFSLWAYPAEGEECGAALQNAQKRLDAQQAGIRLGCEQSEYGAQVFAAKKPATMTDEDASARVAEVWAQAITYEGVWTFTGMLP